MPTLRELRRAGHQLAQRERFNPRDVDLLLGDLLGRELAWLIAHDETEIDDSIATDFESMLARRAAGEPLQYIRGRCEFYGRDFIVDERVLVPRPETEHLVEAVVDLLPEGGALLDVGTGSGCIAVTAALERPDATIFASDLAIDALTVARENASRLSASVRFTCGRSLDPFRGRLDGIASNPPYVPAEMLESLQREVREWEPRIALTPGRDGLEVIETLLRDASRLLRRSGFLVMEIGFDQREDVERLAREHEWRAPEFVDDLAAIPRVAVLRR